MVRSSSAASGNKIQAGQQRIDQSGGHEGTANMAAQDAVEELCENPWSYDIVLTDVHMHDDRDRHTVVSTSFGRYAGAEMDLPVAGNNQHLIVPFNWITFVRHTLIEIGQNEALGGLVTGNIPTTTSVLARAFWREMVNGADLSDHRSLIRDSFFTSHDRAQNELGKLIPICDILDV
uniref:Uncharacterized protein n=1 Tax=Oryza punctata TaxID=4537 RepID=A0A0E0L273_ORYPU